jgi:hypothetical protein
VKIDVEGATYDILHDLSEACMLDHIQLMHIETESYPFFQGQRLDDECCRLLEDHHFECIMKTGFYPTKAGEQYDSVWIRRVQSHQSGGDDVGS